MHVETVAPRNPSRGVCIRLFVHSFVFVLDTYHDVRDILVIWY
jgi:hypothetical protein